MSHKRQETLSMSFENDRDDFEIEIDRSHFNSKVIEMTLSLSFTHTESVEFKFQPIISRNHFQRFSLVHCFL